MSAYTFGWDRRETITPKSTAYSLPRLIKLLKQLSACRKRVKFSDGADPFRPFCNWRGGD